LEILIKTLQGLETCLAEEVRALGGTQVKVLNRAVSCDGNLAFIYRANYALRTALRILVPIATFRAKNQHAFEKALQSIDWSDHLSIRQTFAIDDSIAGNATLRHSKFAALKVKDSIADFFMEKKGRRPSVDVKNPNVLFNLHGSQDQYTLSIDSSGKPLNQRGYRQSGHQATLNEVLAAGMLKIARWDTQQVFMDPMCGSGTLAIEAAMLAQNLPAQILRSEFGFMNWDNFNAILWNRVKAEVQNEKKRTRVKIYASDHHPAAIKMIKASARALRLASGFEIDQKDFLKMAPPAHSGMLISNPPYGKRLGGDEINDFYKLMGDKLKQDFSGWDAWMISSNVKALKALRLRPSEKVSLFNGSLDCQYCHYEMYEGSRD